MRPNRTQEEVLLETFFIQLSILQANLANAMLTVNTIPITLNALSPNSK